jgi:hypothetical protein
MEKYLMEKIEEFYSFFSPELNENKNFFFISEKK